MKISFVLPGVSRVPVGGYKMIFEYANRLCRRGHDITLIFHCFSGMNRNQHIPKFVKLLYYYFGAYYFPTWFTLDSRIHKICKYKKLIDSELPDGDVICATAIDTAYEVAETASSKGKKVYFIQDYENWNGWTDDKVRKSYCLGMKNIVIAKWLQKIVKSAGADSILIPNGIDFKVFDVDIPISQRTKPIISMLYHKDEHKGSKYGIEALRRLKTKYPALQAILFGTPARPKDLPDWIQYIQNATQEQLRKIYNQSLIYLCPSIKEGFGLTGAEAMACGAAYVASDYGGVHEYTVEGRNVLLSAPKDVDGLINNISRLFDDEKKRIQLAENGYKDIKVLNWDDSVIQFENVIKEIL
ncbi:glycosyltransferase family 4 protein [Mitsuokella sp. AF21-1AC]|uniref:glycosyltransferase family 4 protein n=1 Tax=Mitsuokella sp. AF21-1AC TaxID=2292235 RepID=UPI000E4E5327|nr:glycosyltransferase family 4 protein [Mitsuokella sp. AF21-1AC]RGS70688.1 glycosyltransferase [Mitsuokella sp. AF21-1AC]